MLIFRIAGQAEGSPVIFEVDNCFSGRYLFLALAVVQSVDIDISGYNGRSMLLIHFYLLLGGALHSQSPDFPVEVVLKGVGRVPHQLF